MLSQETLERVFQRRFNLSGDNYKGCCPFHDERTPSFFVHKDDLIANCFGCGVSGSIDVLASQLLSVSKEKARQQLDISAEEIISRGFNKANGSRVDSGDIPESWLGPWKKEAHRYTLDRGFEIDVLKKADSRYDSNLKRQVFPVRSRDGQLKGAVGRSVIGQEPRWYIYWNSNTIKEQLYTIQDVHNLWSASHSRGRESTLLHDSLILVEGPFDCLWLEQNEYQAAATLGTKITQAQIEHLLDITNHVYLALDNDTSGIGAMEKLYRKIKRSLSVEFIQWPTKDPVGLTQEEIQDCINNSKNYVQWKSLRDAETSSRISL